MPPRGTTGRAGAGITPIPTGVGLPTRGTVAKGKTTWKVEGRPTTEWKSEFGGGIPAGMGGISGMGGVPYTHWTLEVKGVSEHEG